MPKTTTTPMFLWAGFITRDSSRKVGLTSDEAAQHGGEVGMADELRIWADRLDAVWDGIQALSDMEIDVVWDYEVVEPFGAWLRQNYDLTTDAKIDAMLNFVMPCILTDEVRIAVIRPNLHAIAASITE